MLKKSKRTLSLLLALIMVCSTMGITAFAAENINGTVYEFSGSKAISLQTSSNMGTTYYTTCTIYVAGSWHPGDGSFCWLTPYTRCAFAGSLSGNFSYDVTSRLTDNTLVMEISYEENNDPSELVYKIEVTFDEDESLSVKCYKRNGNQWTSYSTTTMYVSLEEA